VRRSEVFVTQCRLSAQPAAGVVVEHAGQKAVRLGRGAALGRDDTCEWVGGRAECTQLGSSVQHRRRSWVKESAERRLGAGYSFWRSDTQAANKGFTALRRRWCKDARRDQTACCASSKARNGLENRTGKGRTGQGEPKPHFSQTYPTPGLLIDIFCLWVWLVIAGG
jgi:hypothetical protein